MQKIDVDTTSGALSLKAKDSFVNGLTGSGAQLMPVHQERMFVQSAEDFKAAGDTVDATLNAGWARLDFSKAIGDAQASSNWQEMSKAYSVESQLDQAMVT